MRHGEIALENRSLTSKGLKNPRIYLSAVVFVYLATIHYRYDAGVSTTYREVFEKATNPRIIQDAGQELF